MWGNIQHSLPGRVLKGRGFDEHMHVKQIDAAFARIVIVLPAPHMGHVSVQPAVHEGHNLWDWQGDNYKEMKVIHQTCNCNAYDAYVFKCAD